MWRLAASRGASAREVPHVVSLFHSSPASSSPSSPSDPRAWFAIRVRAGARGGHGAHVGEAARATLRRTTSAQAQYLTEAARRILNPGQICFFLWRQVRKRFYLYSRSAISRLRHTTKGEGDTSVSVVTSKSLFVFLNPRIPRELTTQEAGSQVAPARRPVKVERARLEVRTARATRRAC